jgi:hypothetical protein
MSLCMSFSTEDSDFTLNSFLRDEPHEPLDGWVSV